MNQPLKEITLEDLFDLWSSDPTLHADLKKKGAQALLEHGLRLKNPQDEEKLRGMLGDDSPLSGRINF